MVKSINQSSFSFSRGGQAPSKRPKKRDEQKANSPVCGCVSVLVVMVSEDPLKPFQMFAIAQATLCLVGSYHIVGFLYSVFLLMICLLLITCEGLYSRSIYNGTWCNVCRCLAPENFARLCFSVVFKILFFLLLIGSLCISAVQIANLVKDP